MKRSFTKYALLAGALMVCLPAFAAKLPDHYPKAFDRWGVIDQVDLDNLILVVNDVNIRVTRDLRVNTLNTRFALAQSLQPGMKIGFGTTGSRALGGAVSEVWVLPADHTPSRSEDRPAHERRKGRE